MLQVARGIFEMLQPIAILNWSTIALYKRMRKVNLFFGINDCKNL